MTRMIRLVAALAIALLMVPSIVAAQDATPGTSPESVGGGFSQDSLDLVESYTQLVLLSCPGVAVYLDSSQIGTFQQASGFADVDQTTPLDQNAPFQIGSNTKMMTAAIILQLLEAGELTLDTTLDTWFPDIQSALSDTAPITVYQLLTHTSGLYDYVEDLASSVFVDATHEESDRAMTAAWTPQEIIDYVVTFRAANKYFEPGTEGAWHYSNTNYILLGMIIERITGASYADALSSRIFDPLGMSDTYLAEGSLAPDQIGRGYYHGIDMSSWNLMQAWAAGAVVSTATDMAIFMRALLGGELFADPATLELMKSGVDAPSVGGTYGLGLIGFGNGVWGHGGETLAYESAIAYQPERDLVLVAWTNCAPAPIALFSMLLANLG